MTMPVLVVDDSRTMARLARNLLQLIGFSEVDDVLVRVQVFHKNRELVATQARDHIGGAQQ